jgi:hypothetical protein
VEGALNVKEKNHAGYTNTGCFKNRRTAFSDIKTSTWNKISKKPDQGVNIWR